MTTAVPTTLEAAIRDSGEGWLIDWFSPRDQALPHIREVLRSVSEFAIHHVANPLEISERTIIDEYGANPLKVKAFFQALGATRNPEMLLMAWRILQGLEIRELHVRFVCDSTFEILVTLESPEDGVRESYRTMQAKDFALLRHIAAHEIGGHPVLSGFFALNLR